MSSVVVKVRSKGSQKKQLIIVVGKNVSKKATQRNLLKRRMRAIMQPVLKESSKDYTIIIRPEALNLSYQELRKEVTKFLVPNS